MRKVIFSFVGVLCAFLTGPNAAASGGCKEQPLFYVSGFPNHRAVNDDACHDALIEAARRQAQISLESSSSISAALAKRDLQKAAKAWRERSSEKARRLWQQAIDDSSAGDSNITTQFHDSSFLGLGSTDKSRGFDWLYHELHFQPGMQAIFYEGPVLPLLQKSTEAIKRGDFTRAINSAKKAAHFNTMGLTGNPESWFILGVAQLGAGEISAARNSLLEASLETEYGSFGDPEGNTMWSLRSAYLLLRNSAK